MNTPSELHSVSQSAFPNLFSVRRRQRTPAVWRAANSDRRKNFRQGTSLSRPARGPSRREWHRQPRFLRFGAELQRAGLAAAVFLQVHAPGETTENDHVAQDSRFRPPSPGRSTSGDWSTGRPQQRATADDQICLPQGDHSGIRMAEITTRILPVIKASRSLVGDRPDAGRA